MEVATHLVEAALRAARDLGKDVAEVPLTAIAAAAGVSRSTLLRRLGGSRKALDDAVRQAGVDPGGRPPVRERAINAAIRLISERGLGAVTLDAVAKEAGCALPSLHTVFQGRDGLLAAVFDRFGPVLDLETLAARPPDTVEDTVRAIYQAIAAAFGREPRVLPAIFADLFARPRGPGSQLLRANLPRLTGGLGALLSPHVRAGRLRPMPFPLLVQQLLGPVALHLLLRPALEELMDSDLPAVDEAVEHFAQAFLHAALLPEGGQAG
jgi:AcrR family transcriptional regulator